MRINIEIEFKNKNFLILASTIVLAVVMLVTSSITMQAARESWEARVANSSWGASTTADARNYLLGNVGASLALSIVAIIAVTISTISFFKSGKELHGTALFGLLLAFICLSIAFGLTTKDLFGTWIDRDDTAESIFNATANCFPTNVAFMSACGLGFLGGTFAHFKENF